MENIKEMKLMELAEMVYNMKDGEVINFAVGTVDEVDQWGFWCGVTRFNKFDNDNLAYIVSRYGGEAEAYLYHISEYDHRIGEFCEPRTTYRLDGTNRRDKDYIECIARMLADYLINWCCCVGDTITVSYF